MSFILVIHFSIPRCSVFHEFLTIAFTVEVQPANTTSSKGPLYQTGRRDNLYIEPSVVKRKGKGGIKRDS
jgi:hypothetical protein